MNRDDNHISNSKTNKKKEKNQRMGERHNVSVFICDLLLLIALGAVL